MDRGSGTPVLEERGVGLAPDPPAAPPAVREGPPPLAPPPFDEGESWWSPEPRPGPAISNARLGLFVFLGAEVMFFGGLIMAFLVFRFGSPAWPSAGQPRLPIAVTVLNTGILLASGLTMHRALRALRRGERARLASGLGWSAGLGALFLAIQGSEWARLIRFGVRLPSGTYGATFYLLIGGHGLHVLGALVWLLVVRAGARGPRFGEGRREGIAACGLYWYFVVALWPILFVLVYL